MNVREYIEKRISQLSGGIKRIDNPNSDRLTYISNESDIIKSEITCGKVWYLGDGDELSNFYLGQMVDDFFDNPIYNRNKRNYFWALSQTETNIKRVHSGIPKAIIDTLCNAIGAPIVNVNGREEDIKYILDKNMFNYKLTQQARPMTMAQGYGAWKVNIRPDLSDVPLIEYYKADDVDFYYKSGVLIAVIFKSYYKTEDNKNYILFETRTKKEGSSYILYDVFRLGKNNDLMTASFEDVPELKDLQDQVFTNLDMILAVPTKYYFNPLNPDYGRSIFAGKYDTFDMIDETYSQLQHLIRVSGPVEYINPDIIGRGRNGGLRMPRIWNRQIVQKEGLGDGDGKVNEDIVTTQPQLEFEKYISAYNSQVSNALIGIVSPATMGIDIAKKDNADAQREKEKITLMTRNTITANETEEIRDLAEMLIITYDYIKTNNIIVNNYDVDVQFAEIATPSLDSLIQVFGPAWANGEISTEKYVDILWGDKLSDEDKQKEIQTLDEGRKQDNLDMNSILGDGDTVNGNENGIRPDLSEQTEEEETII